MSKLVWDKPGSRVYETGTDRGVLYPVSEAGVAWNGLVSITESPSGAETSPQYSDNIKYLNLLSAEEFGGTIEAFGSPPEFAKCDGSASPFFGLSIGQQPRKTFGLSYRTKIGNDIHGSDYGYKLHIVYNALASPAERAYGTISDSPEVITFSWEFATTPVYVSDARRPTSHISFDSTKTNSSLLEEVETILYGADGVAPRQPTPEEILVMIANQPVFLGIVPDTSGIAALVEGGVDLKSGPSTGIYTAPPETRLTATVEPGRYILES